jgi:L-ascorbate metabolism protein UlaG (beta-lactamase superfamily)
MQIDGVRVLLDPVFTNNLSPVFFVPYKRYQKETPIKIKELPYVDAVFISHDNLDHLEKKAIKRLAKNVGVFIVPERVGNHLRKWGIKPEQIKEYSWWDEDELTSISGEKLTFVCTPARHRSGRGLNDRNRTLWSSWVFIGNTHRAFFSGDTGYAYHFTQIGNHYGPFDLSLLDCGQYNVDWSQSHLFPEQAVRAHLELKSKYFIPIHWGSFSISPHNWWEPPERASAEALKFDVKIFTPKFGHTLQINENMQTDEWWKEFK